MLAGVASIRDRDRSSQATDSALWGSSEVRVLLGLARRWPNEGQGLPRVEVLTLSSRKTYTCSALPSRTLIVHVLPSRYRPMDTCQGSPCVSRRVNARRSRSRRKLLSPKRVSGTCHGQFVSGSVRSTHVPRTHSSRRHSSWHVPSRFQRSSSSFCLCECHFLRWSSARYLRRRLDRKSTRLNSSH